MVAEFYGPPYNAPMGLRLNLLVCLAAAWVACSPSASAQKATTPVELVKLIQQWKTEAERWNQVHGRLPAPRSDLPKQPGVLTEAVLKQLDGNMGIGRRDPSLEAFLKHRLLKQFQPDFSVADKNQLFQIIANMPKPFPMPQPTGSDARRIEAAIDKSVPQNVLDSAIKPALEKLHRAQSVARAKNDPV